MQQLSQSLAENLSALDARFGKSADYYAKQIVLYGCPGCIVMFDGMASLDSLWELLLDAAGSLLLSGLLVRKPMRISCTAQLFRPRAPRCRICRSL